MKRFQILIFAAILLLTCGANLFGQDRDVSGKYEGTADVQPFGKLPIKAEIRRKNGKFSGVFNTPQGDVPILEGTLEGDKLRLKTDAGGEDIFFSGVVGADGKITGEIKSTIANGTFELTRTGDVEPEKDNSPVLRQSKEKWREDLRYLAAEIPKRHKNAFHRVRREQFEKSVAALDANIPSLTDDQIILEMVKLAANIGDGHTGLGWSWNYNRVPIRLFKFGAEFRVVQATSEFPRLNGARLLKIGGVSVENSTKSAAPTFRRAKPKALRKPARRIF